VRSLRNFVSRNATCGTIIIGLMLKKYKHSVKHS
jgi:hypothetical protein